MTPKYIEHSSNPMEILEYMKQVGWIDIANGVRLATRDYLSDRMERIPPFVEVFQGKSVEILKKGAFEDYPYWIFIESEDPLGDVKFYGVPSEENLMLSIKMYENLSNAS